MNKTELAEAVASKAGLSRTQAEDAVNAVTGVITSEVKSGQDVRIIGFGSFKLRSRAARKGRNPQTGASVSIKASKSMAFTPGATLKRELNSRGTTARKSTAAPAKTAKAPAKATAAKTTAKKAAKTPARAAKATAAKTTAKKAAKAPAKAAKTAAKKVTKRR